MEDLGAGFALASHDLEIRGAGELLGETQSGLIDDVGFSLYSEYLSQAIKSIRENKIPVHDHDLIAEKAVQIDLHVPALFPEDFLANAHSRLILYKRISSAADEEQLQELQIEVVDRFGLLPEPAKNLFRVTAIRLRSEKLGISKMDIGESGGVVELSEQHKIDPLGVIQLIQQDPNRFKLKTPNTFSLTDDLEQNEIRMTTVEALLSHLESHLDSESPS